MLERNASGKSFGQKGKDKGMGKGKAMIPMQPASWGYEPWAPAPAWGNPGFGKGQGKWSKGAPKGDSYGWNDNSATIGQFCQHWRLNADAEQKLHRLSPHVLQLVLNEFAPPVAQGDLSGKL